MKVLTILFFTFSFIYASQKATVNEDKSLDKYCIKCHIMYYPEFLPSRSWQKMLQDDELKNHFGKSVSLDNKTKQKFLDYYLKYSSSSRHNKLAKKIDRSILKNDTPLKFSKVPYLKDRHEDLTNEMVIKNKDILSYSNCKACHDKGYKKGIFDEDDVKIPHWHKRFFFGWSKTD